MSAPLNLRAESGPFAGQTFPIVGSVTLGRASGNTIALSDTQLSRRHARFDLGPGGLVVTDLGSANGVYVNGGRIAGPVTLRPGDTVGVGGSTFRVEGPAGASPGPPTVAGFAPPPGYGQPLAPPSSSSPGIPPNIVPPAPPSPPAARRGSPPIALLAAAGVLLLLACAVGGGAIALLAARGGASATATTAPAGTAVPAGTAARASSAASGGAAAGGTQPQAGMVTGRITTAAGQPLPSGASAKITITGTSIAGQIVTYEPAVDAQGRYSQRVADGLYSVFARITFPYNGGVFNLDLAPNDGKSKTQTYDSRNGIVKDFTWKLSGLISSSFDPQKPDSYYGQYLTVSYDTSLKLPTDGGVEFTFSPRGVLADGSAGQVIKRTVKAADVASGTYLTDLPLGPYTVTVAVTGSQPRALRLCIVEGLSRCAEEPGKLVAQAQLDWKPSNSGLGALQMYASIRE